MNTTSKTFQKLKKNLKKGKAHREAFVTSQINIGIPFQIRALRKQQDMDQKALAVAAGMTQPRISAMERPGYGTFTIDTLKRLAAAFDVALIVRFAPFSELIRQSVNFCPDDFEARTLSFEKELDFEARTLSFEKELENISALPQNVFNRNTFFSTACATAKVINENDGDVQEPTASTFVKTFVRSTQSAMNSSSPLFAVA